MMAFIPMPMPKTICVTCLKKKWVKSEVCGTLVGRDMGVNITAHRCHFRLKRRLRASRRLHKQLHVYMYTHMHPYIIYIHIGIDMHTDT